MRTKIAAVVMLLALALVLPNQKLLACESGGTSEKDCSSRRTGMKGWIELHRPDGEIVRINTAQIVFVMIATSTANAAHKRKRALLVIAQPLLIVV